MSSTNSSTGYKDAFNLDGVLHCHHYNCVLQRTIKDPEYIDTSSMLMDAAAEIVYGHFCEIIKEVQDKEHSKLLKIASELCRHRGFGILDLSGMSEKGGRVTSIMSHYGKGWIAKFGKNDTPICNFLSGFIRGVLTAIYNKEFTVSETLCIGKGDSTCVFEVYEGSPDSLIDAISDQKINPVLDVTPQSSTFKGNIDIEKVTTAVAGLGLSGNEEGIIDAFGVYLTIMYGNYYNKISYGFERKLRDVCSVSGLATPLLVESGHVCGFNTFGGIMKSPEWYALVVPDAKNKMDWVEGMVAVINGLGWGTWIINELIDNKKLVIRTYNSYESRGYRQYFGLADSPQCFMSQGTTSAIMNLIYLGNIEAMPELTDSFYDNIFSREDSFYSTETKCFAKGDEYCEFVIERAE